MIDDLKVAFERKMVQQGRSIAKDPDGKYSDYASAVMWSWAQFGYAYRPSEQRTQP